jgi:hypothetical protein
LFDEIHRDDRFIFNSLSPLFTIPPLFPTLAHPDATLICDTFINSLKKLQLKQNGNTPVVKSDDVPFFPLMISAYSTGSSKLTPPIVNASTPPYYLLAFSCLLVSLNYITGNELKYNRKEVSYGEMTFASISDKLALLVKSISGKKFINTIRNSYNPFVAAKVSTSTQDSLLVRCV